MPSAFVGLRSATTEFYVEYTAKKQTPEGVVISTEERKEFPGTVEGAIKLREFIDGLCDKGYLVNGSSDLYHPREFPGFELGAIDIASGEVDVRPVQKRVVLPNDDHTALLNRIAKLEQGLKEAAAHIVKLQKHINALEHGNVGHAGVTKK